MGEKQIAAITKPLDFSSHKKEVASVNGLSPILLIEDFSVMQELYRDALRAAGHTVDVAQDGTLALEMLKTKEYDFIFVDMPLPVMNGLEFLEAYVNRPEHTRIYVLSDFNDSDRVRRARELGVAGYLNKTENPPTRIIELIASLDMSQDATLDEEVGTLGV